MTSRRAESPIAISKNTKAFSSSRPRILVIFGTRPEAIKLCPLISALGDSPDLDVRVCVTGQHRHMVEQVLTPLGVRPDFDLQLMEPGQTLPALTSRLMASLPAVFAACEPQMAVVQGDTTTTFCAALTGFYLRVPVAHVEAGLRTGDLRSPFPEEMNRIATDLFSDLYFPATEGAANNLRKEGVPPERIEVTGNTGIDALLHVREQLESGVLEGMDASTRLRLDDAVQGRRQLLLVTAHRRENFGHGFEQICKGITRLAARPDVAVVWPVHPNPEVRRTVDAMLRGRDNVILLDPLPYVPFVDLMRRAHILLTDSGGIQEEAPSLGKPVLVLRRHTERPEAVAAETVRLVGTDPEQIVNETCLLLENGTEYQRRSSRYNPYGDGQASARIVRRIADYLRT